MTTPCPPLHPACAAYPMLSDDELEAMAMTIQPPGRQHEPCVLLNGTMLDGKNRWAACDIAGVEPLSREFGSDPNDGDDPWRFVLHKNVRRNMTTAGKAFAADALSAASARGAPEGNQNAAQTNASNEAFVFSTRPITQEEAAKAHGIGRPSVQDARVIREDAPEKMADVIAGRIKLRDLATELRAARGRARPASSRARPSTTGTRRPTTPPRRSPAPPTAPRRSERDIIAGYPQLPQRTGEELGRPSAAEGQEQHPDYPTGWTRHMVHGLNYGHIAAPSDLAQQAARQHFQGVLHWLRQGLELNLADSATKWADLPEAWKQRNFNRERLDMVIQALLDWRDQIDQAANEGQAAE